MQILEENTNRAIFEQSTHLGPARVKNISGGRVELDLFGEGVWAFLALAYPYQPEEGDTVLAIGQGGFWYIIGILQGKGKTTFTAPGDLELRCPRGRISMIAAKGVLIKSPEVKVIAKRLELLAETFMERFVNATRWVKEALQLHAGRMRTVVDGDYRLKGERILERAEGDVKIDGKKIHLG